MRKGCARVSATKAEEGKTWELYILEFLFLPCFLRYTATKQLQVRDGLGQEWRTTGPWADMAHSTTGSSLWPFFLNLTLGLCSFSKYGLMKLLKSLPFFCDSGFGILLYLLLSILKMCSFLESKGQNLKGATNYGLDFICNVGGPSNVLRQSKWECNISWPYSFGSL